MRLFLFVLIFSTHLCAGQHIERLLQAESQLLVGDTTGSTLVFRKILDDYPDSYVAALRLSEIQYQRRIFNESVQFANIAEDILNRKLDSLQQNTLTSDDSLRLQTYLEDYSDLHLLKGKIRVRQHRYTDAVSEFEKALVNTSDPSVVHQNIGVALIQQNREDEAIDEFQKAITKNPSNTAALMNLGNIYYARKEYISATFFYIRVTEINPMLTAAYNHLGGISTAQGDYTRALEYYTMFLEFEESEEILFKRAVIKAELLKWESSIDDWDQVLEMNPENSEAYRNRGLCYFQLQDFPAAIENFSRALALNPEPYTFINRGYCYYLVDEPDKALEDMNRGLEELPEYRLGFYFRGLTYRRLHKRKKACSDLARAIELGMEESEINRDFLGSCL